MERVGNWYKLLETRDLNGRVRDRVREGLTGAFAVSNENKNGKSQTSLIKGSCEWVIYTSSNNITTNTLG